MWSCKYVKYLTYVVLQKDKKGLEGNSHRDTKKKKKQPTPKDKISMKSKAVTRNLPTNTRVSAHELFNSMVTEA